MARSFLMAIGNVAQTWYSSLRPRIYFVTEVEGNASHQLLRLFSQSQSLHKLYFSVPKIQTNTFNRLSEDSFVFKLKHQQSKLTLSSKPWSR
jgi:hypothetical protein